jgi:signal peptidase I
MVEQNKSKKHRDAVTEVTAIFEELAGALIMALMIIGFVVQPFIIPTGSMAETLRGMHFRQRCPQCGFRYERNFEATEFGYGTTQAPRRNIAPPVSRCPNCGFYNEDATEVDVARGDKILAIKCLYNFTEPKRWDVVVFKNPTHPPQNYIKRLIGKPLEKVEIIDGDIYINDKIARKPPKVQNELWMPVYNSAYEPINPELKRFNYHKWRIPMVNFGNSLWHNSRNGDISFTLDSMDDRQHRLAYDITRGNNFGINYAYNNVDDFTRLPQCSDLRICFTADIDASQDQGLIGACLRKYQRTYKGWLASDGRMYIAEIQNGREVVLKNKETVNLDFDKPVEIKFSNVDHLLVFEAAGEKIEYDLGLNLEDIGTQKREAEPPVEIIGTGNLKVWDISIFRDIYYTSESQYSNVVGNAVEGHPITLAEDEFFVLGDNSPASADGRWWSKDGIGNNGKTYRKGIVPRDYMLGKAIVVFWPSGFKPFEKFPLRLIPDVSRFRLIYGGSNKSKTKD